MEQYREDFRDFRIKYGSSIMDGAQIGMEIVKFADYFAEYNLSYASAKTIFNSIAQSIENSTDQDGKKISSAKAKVMSDATPEATEYIKAQAHVENIDQYINALKALQKGVMADFSHM